MSDLEITQQVSPSHVRQEEGASQVNAHIMKNMNVSEPEISKVDIQYNWQAKYEEVCRTLNIHNDNVKGIMGRLEEIHILLKEMKCEVTNMGSKFTNNDISSNINASQVNLNRSSAVNPTSTVVTTTRFPLIGLKGLANTSDWVGAPTKYGSAKHSPNNTMYVSDDEDDFDSHVDTRQKLKRAKTTANIHTKANIYRQFSNSKVQTKKNSIESKMCQAGFSIRTTPKPSVRTPIVVPKKLSFTPMTSAKGQTTAKVEAPIKSKQRKKAEDTTVTCLTDTRAKAKGKNIIKETNTKHGGVESDSDFEYYSFKPGCTLPDTIRCNFKPTPAMQLNPEQIKICAYIWHPEQDPNEILFKMENTFGSREHFQCFCPGKNINSMIITWMTCKTTWWQKRITNQTIWSLPPSFVVDMNWGMTIEDFITKYANDWMQPYKDLTHIYIPIEEESNNHWYLMVIAVEDQIVFHFDSNIQMEMLESRKETMINVFTVIQQMLGTNFYPQNYLSGYFEQDGWDLVQPRGLPKCGHSNNSVVWVMKWLDMENGFSQNIVPVLEERVVRMRIAMALITDSANENWKEIEQKVEPFWRTVWFSKTS